ncbi:MAG: hypothetical protein ACK5G9_07750 [Akkermansiaceae bacterium]
MQLKATGSKGKNYLFFGNPYAKNDFLYCDELEAFHKDGILTLMYLAWSRDQKENIYVQKLMLKQGAEMWKWLQEGASASYIAMLKKDKRHLRAVY